MTEIPPLYEFLYTSSLAPARNVGEVAAFVRASRVRNAERGITGTLVFDGQRFCQYLEGDEQDVCELGRRIARDPRHTDFVIRHTARRVGPRRFARWSLGYALAHDGSDLDAFDQLQGSQAVEQLMALLPACELEP